MTSNSLKNQRIAKNSIFLSLRMVLVLCLTFYTTRIVLQILGVEDYGVYNVVCGFVSMFAFLNTSMSNGIQRFFNFEYGRNGEEGANKVFCTAVIIQFILAVFVILLTESFGLWYIHNKMVIPDGRVFAAEWIFQFALISFLLVIMQAPFSAAVMAHERMDFYALISVLDSVLKIGVVFVLPFFNADQLIMYGLLMVGISLTNFILYYSYCKRNFKEIKLRRYFNRSQFLSMLGFSGWNLFGSFSGVMKEQGINLVINYFFGPVVNAARGVASQVNAGMQSFVSNITMPVRPQVVQSYACGDLNRTMNLTYSISKMSCCFLAMMAIPASLEIDFILYLWLGENIPEHTAVFTVIVLFSSMTTNLNSAISNVVHATGEMKHYQLWGSLVKMSSVPISFVLLKIYDVPEIALITVFLCGILAHTVSLFVVKSLIKISLIDYTKKVVMPIIGVIIITFITTTPLRFCMEEGVIRLMSVIAVSIITVCVSVYYIAFNDGEKQLARQFYKVAKDKILRK